MEHIFIVLRARIILAFLCSVYIKTLSVNEKDVPDSYFVFISLAMAGSHN